MRLPVLAALAALSGALPTGYHRKATFEKKLEQEDRKLERALAKIEELKAEIDAERKMDGNHLEQRIEQMFATLTTYGHSFDTIHNTIAAIKGRVDSAENTLDALQGSINALEGRIDILDPNAPATR